uniref:C-type lectin domain-containing protein n=1 Tax=Myripristis murdjan TaxID=586833 RepID=A0A667ZCU4_9TELE
DWHPLSDTNATGHHDTGMDDIHDNNNLTKERDTLRDERDQLRTSISNLTQEHEQLQSRYSTVVTSRDELQEEVKILSGNITEKVCRSGWIKYRKSCYYISTSRKTWSKSRQDCQDRGADLVIINSREEQTFLSRFNERLWIGLSDRQSEGNWKWVDGTDLVGDGFWQAGEPNDDRGKEDCVEVARQTDEWNDLPCSTTVYWACEE